MTKSVRAAIVALSKARTVGQYRAALKLAGKCERIHQLALVDSILEARTRCLGVG